MNHTSKTSKSSPSYPSTLLSKAFSSLSFNANSGTKHFVFQSLTALALIPLVIWFCLSLAFLPDANYATIVEWLSSPFNSILMILTMLTGLYHGALGIESILEDYVSTPRTQKSAILSVKLALFFFSVLGIASLIKIAFF